MEKYLALVRENWEVMSGTSVSYKAKVSSEKSKLEEWFDSFQDSPKAKYEKIIIPNFPELEEFFEICIVPELTEEEIEEVQKFLDEIMKD